MRKNQHRDGVNLSLRDINKFRLSPADISEVLFLLQKELHQEYLDNKIAEEINLFLQQQRAKNAYCAYTKPQHLAARLTVDLQELAQDKHLRIEHWNQASQEHDQQVDYDRLVAQTRFYSMLHNNFGFEQIQRLRGNIGYLDIRAFVPAEVAKDVASAAMTFLSSCRALIFDLRRARGGHMSMVQLLASYLFEPKPRLLSKYYFPRRDYTEEYWTQANLHLRRPRLPIYILTSRSVFSAAEDFAYSLQAAGRAKVIGEVTGGGAHAIIEKSIQHGFIAFIPIGLAQNPITRKNWEREGVIPDIEVEAENALETAHLDALSSIFDASTSKIDRQVLNLELSILRFSKNQRTVCLKQIENYVGKYGNHLIFLKNGQLHHQLITWIESLIPLSTTEFVGTFKGKQNLRFKFLRHKDCGFVLRITRREDGAIWEFPKESEKKWGRS